MESKPTIFSLIDKYNESINSSEKNRNKRILADYIVKNYMDIFLTYSGKNVYTYATLLNLDSLKIIHKSFLYVYHLLHNKHPFNTLDPSGYAPIHYTIIRNLKEQAHYLINNVKVDIDKKDSNGNTPLHLACIYNKLHLLKLLIISGAQINISNNKGETPLYLSVVNQNIDIIKYLLQKKSKIVYIAGNRYINIYTDIVKHINSPELTLLFDNYTHTINKKEKSKKYQKKILSKTKSLKKEYDLVCSDLNDKNIKIVRLLAKSLQIPITLLDDKGQSIHKLKDELCKNIASKISLFSSSPHVIQELQLS